MLSARSLCARQLQHGRPLLTPSVSSARSLCAWQSQHGRALLAPFVPSPALVVNAALDMLQLMTADVFLDLGCGDGRVVEAALRRGVGRAVGVELSLELALAARKRVRAALRSRSAASAEILQADFCAAECASVLHSASALYIFLSPAGARFASDLSAPRAPALRKIVSCDFPLLDDPRWRLEESRRVMDLELFMYARSNSH
ncbi:hypothetical protein T492DRAFT_1077835 [Pavlovales sp. CCMP2436]|nr:hypothetical protein T492DRAFT_1077835 [Pavlovales sp. CCMP2436]